MPVDKVRAVNNRMYFHMNSGPVCYIPLNSCVSINVSYLCAEKKCVYSNNLDLTINICMLAWQWQHSLTVELSRHFVSFEGEGEEREISAILLGSQMPGEQINWTPIQHVACSEHGTNQF